MKLLGGLVLEGPDGPVEGRMAQRRRQALLAVLAVPSPRLVSRDKLVSLMWPESSPDRARHHLSDALYNIRQELGEEVVASVGDDLRLDGSTIVTDVGEFESALAEGDLDAAVSRYGGPFLDGIHIDAAYEFEEWMYFERERLEQKYRIALEGLAEAASARGDRHEAAEKWRSLTLLDPLSSHYALGLMRALAEVGERAKAIQHAVKHEARIREELEVPPDPAVVEFAVRLRSAPPDALRVRRGEETGSAPKRSERPDRSIAVLPFVNMSSDPTNEYFADGMTEELVNTLARVPELSVAARTSSFALKGKRLDVREVGERLGVAYVLEGGVRKAGDRLRITVQLVGTERGYQVWTETYDRGLEDVFKIQEEIARSIANALQVRWGVGTLALVRKGTTNVEAYALYLEGRFHLNKRREPAYRKAVECFEKAIAMDFGYALAYSGLADVHLLLASYSLMAPDRAIPRAREAAERSVEIAPELAEALTSLAYARLMERSPVEAETLFRRAQACDPGYATAHHWYAWLLVQQGRFEEALREHRRALELEPLSLILHANLGTFLYLMRRYEEAIEACHRTLDLDSRFVVAHQWLGRSYEMTGRLDEGIAAHRRAIEISGGEDPESLGSLGHAQALADDRKAAAETLARLEAISRHRFVSRYWVAVVRLGLGDADQALDELERAFDEGFDWYRFVTVDPMLDPIREEPRFRALLARTQSEAVAGG